MIMTRTVDYGEKTTYVYNMLADLFVYSSLSRDTKFKIYHTFVLRVVTNWIKGVGDGERKLKVSKNVISFKKYMNF